MEPHRPPTGDLIRAIALLAAALLTATTPAAANPGVVALTCTTTYAAYGVGVSTGFAACQATGSHSGPVSITFATNVPAAICPFGQTALGRMSGALSGDITWSNNVVTTTGNHAGSGIRFEVVTSPLGNPCGASNAQAATVFVIAGS